MSQPQVNKIRIENPSLEGEPRTYLTTDCAVGATTISTLDNTGFVITGTEDYYILIGEYGTEKSEIVLVDANGAGTTSAGFTISATKFTHESSDPVTFIRYNQIQFFGAIASGGTKNLLTTKNIDCTQQFTEYVYEGDSYSYFYSAYYNSTDDKLSAYSDEIHNTSYTRKSIKRIIEAGLRKAMTYIDTEPNEPLTWDTCIEIVQDGIDEIIARKRKWPFLRTIDSSIYTVANQQYISTPSDLLFLEFIKINGTKVDLMTRTKYNNYTANGSNIPTGQPTGYTLKNNKIYLYPTPDQVYPVVYEYYRTIAEITSDLSTEIDFAFLPILIYYSASQFSYIRGNDKRGDKMYQMFVKLLEDQVIEYSGPEQTGEAESIDETSVYGDGDYEIWASLN